LIIVDQNVIFQHCFDVDAPQLIQTECAAQNSAAAAPEYNMRSEKSQPVIGLSVSNFHEMIDKERLLVRMKI
jgi:hypothetical protein